MLDEFCMPGRASFIIGGQFGSEGKGAAAAFVAEHLRKSRNEQFRIVTTNAGAQAGHTSTVDGKTRVVFHLPTASLYPRRDELGIADQPLSYLNAGSIIDPAGLLREIDENPELACNLRIHPNAAIITYDCREAEMQDDSAQTKIASTRKGVGEALSRKVLRKGVLARDVKELQRWVKEVDLNEAMLRGASVLVEVPQGFSLSLNSAFYPHVTSRNCTVMQAMSDAGIHPYFYNQTMMVVRTFPIRVGNIPRTTDQIGQADAPHGVSGTLLGHSGDCYADHEEITWEQLGVKAEITTVTKRVRRVFTFSEQQVREAIAQTRPNVIYLTFCDYVPDKAVVRKMVEWLKSAGKQPGLRHRVPEIITQWGPSTDDVKHGDEI